MKTIFGFLIAVAFATPAYAFTVAEETYTNLRFKLSEMHYELEGHPGVLKELTLKVGVRYKLTFENAGTEKHEVIMGRNLQEVDGHPDGYETYLLGQTKLQMSGSIMDGDKKRIWVTMNNGVEEIELDPKNRISLYFTFSEEQIGDWEMACFAEGHYMMGMKIPLRVVK